MHDIDQVLLEEPSITPGSGGFEAEDTDVGEFDGYELEDEEFGQDFGQEIDQEIDQGFEEAETVTGALGEDAEVELASQFLEIGSEHELEQFLGDLLTTATAAAGSFARSREGRQIGGILKRAAGRVLPVLGRAAGRVAGGAIAGLTGGSATRYRRAGARMGGALGDLARRGFGLELEGLSAEDQEFEVARNFVRFGHAAIRDSVRRSGTAPAGQVAQRAAVAAARRFAPGLVTERVLSGPPLPRWSSTVAANHQTSRPARPGSCPACGSPDRPTSGRWEMRGNTIVLSGH